MSVSVIIPARNEIYLQKTIESVITAAKGDYEIIVVCDGYWPDPPIQDHPNVHLIHHTNPIGQRAATNEAVRIATKKYIMKIDGHTIMDDGFDVKLEADCQPDWTLIPLMYSLDVEIWKPKLHKKPVSHMYIGNAAGRELRIEYWHDYDKRPEAKGDLVDMMAGMGNCFFMERDRYWELDGLDENHGSWGQVGIEIACKSWLSGGRHVLSKKTWFAHWFRKNVGFPYPLSGKAVEHARNYSKEIWCNNKWPKQVHRLEWLINKFAPVPSWDEAFPAQQWIEIYHRYLSQGTNGNKHPYWNGVQIVKWPEDVLCYAEVIFENKPDFIVETGTWKGGSTLFFANLLDIIGKGQVISIDTDQARYSSAWPQHPRITYLKGNSTDDVIVAKVKEIVGNSTCMVTLDSLHLRSHVKWELMKYGPIVTKGQYLVIDDAFAPMHRVKQHHHPLEAGEWFLGIKAGKIFERTDREKRFLISADLWLKRL